MKIIIPEFCLVVLIGPSSCGKSTFARKHFRRTEVLSSDFFRGMVSDDENNQTATPDAFEILHLLAAKRLGARRLTVIDATNVKTEAREPLLALSRKFHCAAVAIVFKVPEELCQDRAGQRPDRNFSPQVISRQYQDLEHSLPDLRREGLPHP